MTQCHVKGAMRMEQTLGVILQVWSNQATLGKAAGAKMWHSCTEAIFLDLHSKDI